MAIGGELAVNGLSEVQFADDGGRAQVEHLLRGRGERRIVNLARAEGLDKDADGPCNADGVGDLNLTLRGETGGNDVLAAKNLATEMTNYNVEEKDLQGETAITVEHVENNTSVRDMLGQRGIKPENLPASEDIKKLACK